MLKESLSLEQKEDLLAQFDYSVFDKSILWPNTDLRETTKELILYRLVSAKNDEERKKLIKQKDLINKNDPESNIVYVQHDDRVEQLMNLVIPYLELDKLEKGEVVTNAKFRGTKDKEEDWQNINKDISESMDIKINRLARPENSTQLIELLKNTKPELIDIQSDVFKNSSQNVQTVINKIIEYQKTGRLESYLKYLSKKKNDIDEKKENKANFTNEDLDTIFKILKPNLENGIIDNISKDTNYLVKQITIADMEWNRDKLTEFVNELSPSNEKNIMLEIIKYNKIQLINKPSKGGILTPKYVIKLLNGNQELYDSIFKILTPILNDYDLERNSKWVQTNMKKLSDTEKPEGLVNTFYYSNNDHYDRKQYEPERKPYENALHLGPSEGGGDSSDIDEMNDLYEDPFIGYKVATVLNYLLNG